MKDNQHSKERFMHHHVKWVEARANGDQRLANQHLYALRAHLQNLGWLGPEYNVPGLGVYDRSGVV